MFVTEHGFVLRMLKHAISEGDFDFSKYLIVERNMDLVGVGKQDRVFT